MYDPKLTKAEKENIRLLAQDNCIKQVADIRNVSPNTVKAQINSAKLKMGCGTVQGLTAKFVLMVYLVLIVFYLITIQYCNHKEVERTTKNHKHLIIRQDVGGENKPINNK